MSPVDIARILYDELNDGGVGNERQMILHAILTAVRDEREACAKIAEAPCAVSTGDTGKTVNQIIAGHIRHRAITSE